VTPFRSLYNLGVDKSLLWLKKRWKRLAVGAVLVILVALAALNHFVWSRNPAEQAVRGLFAAAADDRLDEAMTYVDPDSDLARFWNENRSGIRDRAREALDQYQVSFDLELKATTSGERAEVQLADGTLKVSSRDPATKGAFPMSLKSLNLVFYLEKKGGKWLITGMNYQDLDQLMRELQY
jgi:hypothetical protein